MVLCRSIGSAGYKLGTVSLIDKSATRRFAWNIARLFRSLPQIEHSTLNLAAALLKFH